MGHPLILPQLVCKRCGHKWTPRVPNPKRCPKCLRYGWDEDVVSNKGGAHGGGQ